MSKVAGDADQAEFNRIGRITDTRSIAKTYWCSAMKKYSHLQMRRYSLVTAASFALAAALISSAVSAKEEKSPTAEHHSANRILRQMSDELSNAPQFSFKASRKISGGVAAERGLQADAQIEVYVRRPNAVVATSTSSDTIRKLYFDGKDFTLQDAKENMYATVPLRGSLDTLPLQLAVTYGFVPPLAVFVISNPYKDIRWRTQKIVYAGTANCPSGSSASDPGKCFKIALMGRFADSEVWIAVGDHLPRKMIATLKGKNAGTSVAIDFTEWNLTASLPDQAFVFTPPKDAMKIDMVTTAEMQDAAKAKSKPESKPAAR